ncbi:MAG: hypothetical protein Q4F05_08060 [bacterium]|nr:hypothetical protein [bacterium]
MKKIIYAVVCLLCAMTLYCRPVEAATMKSSYSISSGSYMKESKVTLNGGKKKTILFKVKNKGNFELNLDAANSLKENQQLIIKLVDPKGKTIVAQKATKQSNALVSKSLSKGTYKLIISTKNIKSSSKKTATVSYSFQNNLNVKADGSKVYDQTNKKKQSTYTFISNKNQVVEVYNQITSMKSSDKAQLIIKNSSGKTVKKVTNVQKLDKTVVYLEKGTYTFTFTYNRSLLNNTWIKSVEKYNNNMVTAASSKGKAASYTGTKLHIARNVASTTAATQWIKVDTSKGNYSFTLNDLGTNYEEYVVVNVYKGNELLVPNMELRRGNTGSGKYYFDFVKDTGVYYISILNKMNGIISVEPVSLYGTLKADGTTMLLHPGNDMYSSNTTRNKTVTASLTLFSESYVSLSEGVCNSGELPVVTKNNTVIMPDSTGMYKLNKGTYAITTKVHAGHNSYSQYVTINKPSELAKENKCYLKNKQATITLGKVSKTMPMVLISEQLYQNGYQRAQVKSITIYENGKKIASTTSKQNVLYLAKPNKTYKAVINCNTDTMVKYQYRELSAKLKLNTQKSKAQLMSVTYDPDYQAFVDQRVAINGKTSGWVKVSNTGHSSKIVFHALLDSGSYKVLCYGKDGKLKKTINLNKSGAYGTYAFEAKGTSYFKIVSTNSNTKGYCIIGNYWYQEVLG